MRKLCMVVVISLILGWTAFASAQEVKMIDIKGKVLIKKEANASWEPATKDMILGKESQIQTKGNGQCILSFDENHKRVVTIEKKTTIKIENIAPGAVFLEEGRVFAFIKDIRESKKFEVKTPTAIAGARGTGWETEYEDGQTSISCFDDVVYVASIDKEGNVQEEKDVSEGFQNAVKENGETTDVQPVSDEKKEEWKSVVTTLEMMVIGEVEAAPGVGNTQTPTMTMPSNSNPLNPSQPGMGSSDPGSSGMPSLGGTGPEGTQAGMTDSYLPEELKQIQEAMKDNPDYLKDHPEMVKEYDKYMQEHIQEVKEFEAYIKDNPEFIKENPEIMREYDTYIRENADMMRDFDEKVKDMPEYMAHDSGWAREQQERMKEYEQVMKEHETMMREHFEYMPMDHADTGTTAHEFYYFPDVGATAGEYYYGPDVGATAGEHYYGPEPGTTGYEYYYPADHPEYIEPPPPPEYEPPPTGTTEPHVGDGTTY